jgi:hypothetical protein
MVKPGVKDLADVVLYPAPKISSAAFLGKTGYLAVSLWYSIGALRICRIPLN